MDGRHFNPNPQNPYSYSSMLYDSHDYYGHANSQTHLTNPNQWQYISGACSSGNPDYSAATNRPQGISSGSTSSSSTTSTSSMAQSSNEEPKDPKRTRNYEKWTDDEQKMLLTLWAEKFELLESKDARKAWADIAAKINKHFGTKRTTEKFSKKIKYLIDRYKIAKDWNSNQSGGHRRKSIYYDQIDEVLGCRDVITLQNVKEAGSSSRRDSSETEPSTPKSLEDSTSDDEAKTTTK